MRVKLFEIFAKANETMQILYLGTRQTFSKIRISNKSAANDMAEISIRLYSVR